MNDLLKVLAHPAVFPWVAAVIGLVIGSFLNVVIHRLPKMMERDWEAQCAELEQNKAAGSGAPPDAGRAPNPVQAGAHSEPYNLFVPRSRCPACGHSITMAENVPLLSYAFLRGRCSACRTRINPRYPLVEALGAAAAAYCAARFGFGPAAFAAMVYLWCLIAATFIDFDTQLLPDSITLPLLWLGLLVNIPGTFVDLPSAVIGAAAGYLSLWSVYWAFRLLTGKEGMGFGDFKLLAAIGAWCGWQMLPLVILMSSVIGAAVGIVLIVLSRLGRNVPIPFGPYLAAAGVVALFWGPQLTRHYVNQFL
jgi:leader peptidase (prepilin peptidase) / N-methyltransferase